MHRARGRLLRIGACLLEPPRAHRAQQGVFAEQRGVIDVVGLPMHQRHPVEPVGREEPLPFVPAVFVQEARLVVQELRDRLLLVPVVEVHSALPVCAPMYEAHAANMLRDGISLLPLEARPPGSGWSRPAARCMLTQSPPSEASPSCTRL